MTAVTHHLTVWTFTPLPGAAAAPFKVQATFAMDEARARATAFKKGVSVDGWAAKMATQPVQVIEVLPDGPKTFVVQLERTQYAEVEVEADCEEEAKKLAYKQADGLSRCEWDDGDVEVVSVELDKDE